jgi:putative phosphotransacetylase
MPENKVLINLSNRHLHLSQADLEVLFGKGHSLKNVKDLMQPGQFACDECVTLVGEKSKIEGVRVLGPTRAQTQVEILQSDVYKLGKTQPPVRESGDVKGSAPLELVGPAGKVKLSEGIIIAKRHIHMDPESAKKFGVQDKQIVKIKAGIPGREVVFHDVVIRVNPNFTLECHLDFDEGNACGIGNGSIGEVIL